MGQWSRDEIEYAFAHHKQIVVEIGKTWARARFAGRDLRRTLVRKFRGREPIRDWIVATMSVFPGKEMHFDDDLAFDRRRPRLGVLRVPTPGEGSR